MPFDDDVQPLDDQDEFRTKSGVDLTRYPQVVPGTLRFNQPVMKQEIQIRCQAPGCGEPRWVFVSDLFQVKLCLAHAKADRERKRLERRRRLEGMAGMAEAAGDLDDKDEFLDDDQRIEEILAFLPPEQRQQLELELFRGANTQHCEACGEMVNPDELDIHGVGKCDQRECPRCGTAHRCVRLECLVSNGHIMEELGGVRPAHLLLKAKHDLSWIEYADAEGNTKFMQVHDVRSARSGYGRWAIYGIDQDGKPVHELYDLRHGYEHSGTFSGLRELVYGEIVKLAQQGVIRGEGGKPITTLSGLMQIADEPLRKMIAKKAKEAKAGGPSLEDIEKQIFAEPAASSAQKRRTGKAGTRPWQSTLTSL